MDVDAAVGTDAGPMGTDSGMMGVDAGMMGVDAGPGDDAGGTDAGMGTDAGDTDAGDTDAGGTDAGMMMADAGTDGGSTMDAGTDAGSAMDAGPGACTPDMDIGMAVGSPVSTGSTVGAGNDSMASCGSSSASGDIALSWTAPSTGTFLFDTVGSDYDTTLHIHAGFDCAGTELDCDDDGHPVTGDSLISLDLTAGQMITIVVDGYDVGEEGNYVLNITQYACPDTDLAMMIGDSIASGSTVGEPDDAAPSCDDFGAGTGDASFTWTAPSTGMWTFDTFGSDFDTVLALFTGSSCDFADEVDCDDDASAGVRQSRVDAMLTAGDTVTLVVDGYSFGDEGNFVLSIVPTPSVTSEAGLCADGMDNDRDGATDCADSDCALLARCTETGAQCSNSMDDDGDGDVDCADSDCAGWAACTETACGNSTDDDGDGDVDCADSDCLRRAPCDGCPDTDLGMAIGAAVGTADTTGGTSRRTGSCGGSGPDTTFLFTAPSTGTYTIDTTGTAHDTTLYVLAGGCLGPELACNDNDPAGGSTSSLSIALGAGETVVIVVDGFAGAEGPITLNIATAAMTFGPPTAAGDLVINEIMQNPAGADANHEWFEVYNRTTSTLNLNGCRVFDDGANSFTISGDTLIHPGQYFLFGESMATITPDYVYSGTDLTNMDDEIVIECGSPAVMIDRVAYDGGPMFPDPDGQTMSLDPSARDATMNDVGANWCPALLTRPYDGVNAGTPGRPNPSCP
ncbi:MAG: lamin tail domain-containing protein [Sandaracinaceae bacterium]|nr:lamin tail domain-containing protein [Sandaracinaceae bacterium]